MFGRAIIFLCALIALPLPAQQPNSPLWESFETYRQMKSDTVFGVEWVSLGPVVNSARVEAVQADPAHPGVIYVAFGSGNLWKTVNNGVTWRPLFENQVSHGIGDFALAPSDPNIIYLGTGESLKKARNFTIPGTGIYRSDDAGETWRHLGLSDSWHVGEIAVHPTNPDIVVVAVLGHFWSSNSNRGLYLTEDGGATWKHVLSIDDKTGANDVVWALNDPNVVYASMWENYPDVSGVNSSVYRSSDGGKTWSRCGQGLPVGDQVGRIGLAVSQANSNKVYALVDNRERIGNKGAAQVFKSMNGGESWAQTHEADLKIFSRIGWYFADLYVNPQDDEEIFGLGVRVAHSADGGKSFDLLSGKVSHVVPSAASGLHLDHCEMWIHPQNPNHILLGNDGGLYQSFDKGNSWTHFNNIPAGEFYDIALSPDSPCQIYAGAQDDASVFGPSREMSGVERWKYLWIDPWNGGDGCVSQVDPSDSNTVYYSAQEGAFRRKEMDKNRSVGIRPQLPKTHSGKLVFNFVAPMIISPHDSNTLYLAGNYVFKSSNRGDDWEVVSPDISKTQDRKLDSKAAGAIAESSLKQGLLYLGTDQGAFWVSENGGKNWEQRSNQLPPGYIRSICPSCHSESTVYLTVTGLNNDDLSCHVFASTDKGTTWQSISSNLPNEPANVILEDPVYEDVLYAGLFRAVYISIDRGKTWSMLGRNMPAISVSDLEIHSIENDLVVATHGRGIYKLNLDPIHSLVKNKLLVEDQDYLFSIPTASRPYLSDTRPGVNFRPHEKNTVSYWVRNPRAIKLLVKNEAGKVVKAFDLQANRGLNQFRWDLVIGSTESPLPYFINYKTFLNQGNYQMQMETSDHQSLSRPFKVVDQAAESSSR